VLVDLHAHYPMHVPMDRPTHTHTHDQMRAWSRRRWQARVVNLISKVANYQGPGDAPSVTGPLMREGDVGVALSVLYTPFDEMDLTKPYGALPEDRYFNDVVAELDAVEAYAASGPEDVHVAHSPAELDALVGAGRTALVHAIEGGFQLGRDEAQIRDNVRALADRGVAYVTVAHLFWRSVATSAPALPFLPDWLYHLVFPQPDEGLSDLGRAAVSAMAAHGILVDITHMSERAQTDTLDLLDRLDPDNRVPVIATHMACRFGKLEYCFTDDVIARVARRGGVLGCILCDHYISDGLPGAVKTFEDAVEAIGRHIDHIHDVTGSYDHVGIGSDLDGYIKPALPGFQDMGRMSDLQTALRERYGDETAEKIHSGNALRVLRAAWGRKRPRVPAGSG
jgi:microsomal dipeptidase-like Zn-dependent dipeptidase